MILASGQVAGTGDTTIYTPVFGSKQATITSAVLCNTGSSAVTVSVSLVPSGGSVDGTHKVLDSYSLAAHDSFVVSELVNAVLASGDFVSVNAGTGAVLDYCLTGATA